MPVTPERVAVFFRLVKYFDRMFNTTSDHYSRNLQPKKNPISQDYRVTGSVLGLGINGKVVECFSHKTGEKFALKVDRFSCSFITQILVVQDRQYGFGGLVQPGLFRPVIGLGCFGQILNRENSLTRQNDTPTCFSDI